MLRVSAVAVLASTLGACAMLTGLDQIQEVACAVGCADAAGDGFSWTVDGSVDSGDSDGGGHPWSDAPSTPEASEDDEASAPEPSDDASDDGEPDALATADAGDAAHDAGIDGPKDAAEDAPKDAADDAPGDASGPCGTVYFHDGFADNSHGWTLDSSWSIAPACASPPAPQKGNPDPTADHTGTAGSGLAGAYVCGNNPAGQTSAFHYATSAAVDVSAAPALTLTFYRWLNTDSATYMTSTVDVYDGTQWVNLYTNPGGSTLVTDSAWTKVEYDVTAQKNAAFRVRFGYSITSTSVYQMSCWNVDDVTLSSASCP
jgi:hypothetical protein